MTNIINVSNRAKIYGSRVGKEQVGWNLDEAAILS